MRLGIVFSGGGGKGAYQIGVWKALVELDLIRNIRGIAATSIGSVNSLLFLNGDIEKAINFWSDLRRKDFVELNRGLLGILKSRYISEKDNLNSTVRSNINFNILKTTDISLKIVCTEVKHVGIKKQVFDLNKKNKEEAIEILLGSCSIPLLYNLQYIQSMNLNCCDGGVLSRTPVEVLEYEKYDKIIIVHSDNLNRFNLLKYNKKKYINIYPSRYQGGVYRGLYGFTQELVMSKIELGYVDTLKKLSNL